MKIIKAFFVMLHIQLAIQYAIVPLTLFDSELLFNSKILSTLYFVSLILFFIATQVVGWIAAVTAIKMYLNSETENLDNSWNLLKLKTVPFYILNFIYCIGYCFVLIGASRGMIWFVIIPMLIPIWYTCAFIIQSGFFGTASVAVLRKRFGNNISVINYLLQFIPVLDVIDTIALRHKVKKLQANFTEEKIQ